MRNSKQNDRRTLQLSKEIVRVIRSGELIQIVGGCPFGSGPTATEKMQSFNAC